MRWLAGLLLCGLLVGCGVKASCCHKAAAYEPYTDVCLGDADRCEAFRLEFFLSLLSYAQQQPALHAQPLCTTQVVREDTRETQIFADEVGCSPDPALYERIRADAQTRLNEVRLRLKQE